MSEICFNTASLEDKLNDIQITACKILPCEEKIEYILNSTDNFIPTLWELQKWKKLGTPKFNIEDETKFCDREVLSRLLVSKNKLNEVNTAKKWKTNPYECLGKAIFLNRSALKMANIDASFDFIFTNPRCSAGSSLLQPDEVLFFADICAAPGGFSEYVIWRRKESSPRPNFADVHGFGFTLKKNKVNLNNFRAGPPEYLELHYGIDGIEGSGNICVSEYIQTFCGYVRKATFGRGVHFAMADGAFNTAGKENIQEILYKRLLLCQFTIALGIVREEGHFVTTLFDCFTPFTVGLIFLMYKCFEKVYIHKPITSRPANSERFLVCIGLKSGCEHVYNHLIRVNESFKRYKGKLDVIELISMDCMTKDRNFMDYITKKNEEIAEKQIVALEKFHLKSDDPTLLNSRKEDVRAQALAHWKIPDYDCKVQPRYAIEERVPELLAFHRIPQFDLNEKFISKSSETNQLISIFDYSFVLLSNTKENRKEKCFLVSLGGRNIFRSEHLINTRWERVNHNIELPPDTILYGEFVEEIKDLPFVYLDPKSDVKYQKLSTAFHIIDGIFLNGYDVSKLHLTARHEHIEIFCLAINKHCRPDLIDFRAKTLYRVEDMAKIFLKPNFGIRNIKGHGFNRVMKVNVQEGFGTVHVHAYGVAFLRMTVDPWMVAFSNSRKKKYFFNTATNQSLFTLPENSTSDFSNTHNCILNWYWRPGTRIVHGDEDLFDYLDDDSNSDSDLLHLSHFEDMAKKTLDV